MRHVAAGALVLLALAGCSSSGESTTGTTVPITTTTLPPSNTTTTLPPRTVTSVDACSLLTETDLEVVLEEAGGGEPAESEPVDPEAGVPALITAECSWPSIAEGRLVLSYLAPTTATDGPQHLEDVLAAGTGFAEGGRVLSQQAGAETVGVLIDDHEMIRELAVVKRSALLYLLVDQEVSARDATALTDYATLLADALRRAPR